LRKDQLVFKRLPESLTNPDARMLNHKAFLGCLLALLLTTAVFAATGTVCIVHTNDLHDHIRPGYNGEGGLPYVAGYVAALRAQRPDVLVLDAGDVLEKGDMVSYATGGSIMYEAMRRIGYDAAVPGNHDVKGDLAELDRRRDLLGAPFLCANLLRDDGAPRYPASRVFDVGGVKVGVIGLTRESKRAEIPDFAFSKKALAAEAARLAPETHLVVAVVHEGVAECLELSAVAPDVDVFVSGHTHQVLHAPRRVEGTGGVIVQAGCNARYVGQLEVTVDLDGRNIIEYAGKLVSMSHLEIPVDEDFLAWVRDREQEVCPEASREVAYASKEVGPGSVGFLIAAALREEAQAEAGLCMTDRVVRNGLPEGPIDVNALFRACAPWALDVVTVSVAGEDLLAYLGEYVAGMDRPSWDGFAAVFRIQRNEPAVVRDTTLEPARSYTVALTAEEWKRRLAPFLEKRDANAALPEATPCAFNVLDALEVLAGRLAESEGNVVANPNARAATADLHAYATAVEAAARPRAAVAVP